jgi:hypothetical protein
MKKPSLLYVFAALFLFAFSAAAQKKQPPAMAPDYFPENWKEFSYPEDQFSIRFPKAPKITDLAGEDGDLTNLYKHAFFIALEVHVTDFKADLEQLGPLKEMLGKARDAALAEIKAMEPKIIRETDVTQNGRQGKFMQIETNDGAVIRFQFFVVKNRLYYMFASVKKGERHGVNWENDFEKVAMGFLNSFKFI